jgi:hypothetical protein
MNITEGKAVRNLRPLRTLIIRIVATWLFPFHYVDNMLYQALPGTIPCETLPLHFSLPRENRFIYKQTGYPDSVKAQYMWH